jgi:hypothetical protein
MPLGLDSVLRWILVKPDVHRVHHSILVREINSNFGFSFARRVNLGSTACWCSPSAATPASIRSATARRINERTPPIKELTRSALATCAITCRLLSAAKSMVADSRAVYATLLRRCAQSGLAWEFIVL